LPRRPPRGAGFPESGAFAPHLQARLEPVALSQDLRTAVADAGPGCLLLVAGQAFTARLAQPVALALVATQPQPLELLHPSAALAQLAPGTSFHLLVGTSAVAKGVVEQALAPAPLQPGAA
jgi:hypothetical protein